MSHTSPSVRQKLSKGYMYVWNNGKKGQIFDTMDHGIPLLFHWPCLIHCSKQLYFFVATISEFSGFQNRGTYTWRVITFQLIMIVFRSGWGSCIFFNPIEHIIYELHIFKVQEWIKSITGQSPFYLLNRPSTLMCLLGLK